MRSPAATLSLATALSLATSALSLAVSTLLGCGGGSAEAPPAQTAASSCDQGDVQLTPVSGGYVVSCGRGLEPVYLSAEELVRRGLARPR